MSDERARRDRRLYVWAFALGVVAFLFGLGLDQVAAFRDLIPDYAAADVIWFQLVFGFILLGTLAAGSGRWGGMFLWDASLWLLGGLLAGWVFWVIALIAAGGLS